ncbi:TPA: hypothetical protein ACH3X2_14267 [Trebouxia sp. C0005]
MMHTLNLPHNARIITCMLSSTCLKTLSTNTACIHARAVSRSHHLQPFTASYCSCICTSNTVCSGQQAELAAVSVSSKLTQTKATISQQLYDAHVQARMLRSKHKSTDVV